jgi:hypothetical protein
MMKGKTILSLSLLLVAACAGNDDEPAGARTAALQASCVAQKGDIPAGGWACGETQTVECNAAQTAVDFIYVTPADAVCDGKEFQISDEGPFTVGTHTITVTGEAPPDGEAPTCTSTLVVKDVVAPTVTPRTSELWPPNHKFHTIRTSDCVEVKDACDASVHVAFTFATSDEPANSTGDGNTDEDIRGLGCDAVELLSERKGNGDARVYTLGFRATDAAGNATEGTCKVIVPHDQGKKEPVESAEAYRVTAPTACGAPTKPSTPR